MISHSSKMTNVIAWLFHRHLCATSNKSIYKTFVCATILIALYFGSQSIKYDNSCERGCTLNIQFNNIGIPYTCWLILHSFRCRLSVSIDDQSIWLFGYTYNGLLVVLYVWISIFFYMNVSKNSIIWRRFFVLFCFVFFWCSSPLRPAIVNIHL